MAGSAREQQQLEEHNEQLSSFLRQKKENDTSGCKRHSSAPPQQRQYRAASSAVVLSDEQKYPFQDHNLNLPHRRRERPNAAQRVDSAAALVGTKPAAVITTPSLTADRGSSSGTLSFPKPKFSAAVKLVEEDGVSTLVSKATGRRWMTVTSSRKCQFGEVLRAVELSGNSTGPMSYFAIKELSMEKLREMEGRTHEDPLREVAALQYLSREGHPNILTCTEALRDKNNIYIVTPFYGGGEIFDVVADQGRFDEDEVRLLFRQVLDGLLHLKAHGVCHRDVSLENLMFDEGNVVKLVDFGLALRIPQTADGSARVIPPQGVCGKEYYMSPEVLTSSGGFDGFAVDVWACGVLLFILLTGVPPFELAVPSLDQRCQIVAVEERLPELLSAWEMPLSPEVTELIQSCLLFAPDRRPSLETLRNHPWINA